MSSASTNAKKRCQNCLEEVKIYITCFKCDAAYHIYCWKKVLGAYVNKRGQLFCCDDLTSKYATTDTNLGTQDNLEGVIEKGNLDDYKEDLKNCPIKQEDSEWNEFKCGACHLEFTNKEYLENHCSECPNKEGEFIQALKGDHDLENYLHKEEDVEWSEFKCGACLLELTNKENLINHYSECPNKEEEFIQELKEDKVVENHLPEEENSEANEKHLENHCHESPNKQGESAPGLNKDKAGLCCSFCDEEHFQKESYEQHIKQCYIESSCSQFNKDDRVHITNTKRNPAQVDHKEENYKRNVCNYTTHIKECAVKCIYSDETSFKCDMCDYTAKETETLKSHFSFSTPFEDACGSHQQIYISERLFKCDWCDYTAAQGMNLKIHIESKHSNAAKKCKCKKYCKYSTHQKATLVNHIRTHTNEKPFKCDMCDYAAAQRQYLKIHVLAKHSNAAKKHKCKDCKYSAHSKITLVRHIRTHTNEKPFKCDMCDYAAAQRQNLKSHVLVKHSNADKEYKCKDCEYSAHKKTDLVNHIRTHTNEKPFKCNICDYAAAGRQHLKRHILAKHSDTAKKYKCKDCKFSTHTKTTLVKHVCTHTNEKPFKCDMCDYAAVQKQILKKHVLAKHSNADKEYKCRDCKYSTHVKAHLVSHVRTHTKEKPFK